MALSPSNLLHGTNEPHDTTRVPLTDVKKVRNGRVSYEFLSLVEERIEKGHKF